MALHINHPETDRLARELAARMGTSITTALRTALEERLTRMRPQLDTAYSDIQAIIDRGRSRAVHNNLSEAAILGYGNRGLPA